MPKVYRSLFWKGNVMFCSKCGKSLADDARFCSGCGNPVNLEPAPVVAEPIPAPVAVEPAPVAVEPEPAPAVAEPVPAPAAAEPTPAPLPESFSEATGAQTSIAAKKKKRRLGPIIGGAAVVLVGAAAAVGYFCFSNQIMRLIKGDKEYAREIAEKSYTDYLFNGEEINLDELDYAIAENMTTALAEMSGNDTSAENAQLFAMMNSSSMSALLNKYGDSQMKMNANIEFKSLLNLVLGSNDEVGTYLDLLNGFEAVAHAQRGEAADKYTYSFNFEQDEIMQLEQYISDNISVLAVPSFFEDVFYLNREAEEFFPTEEAKRIREEITAIIEKHYPEAEFIYTDGEFTVAGTTVTGTEIKTVFSNELCRTIYNEIDDFCKNDETLRGWYDKAKNGEAAESEQENDGENEFNGELTFCNYIAPHSEIIGKTVIINNLSEEEDGSVAVSFVKGDETRLAVDTPEGGKLSFTATSDTISTALGSTDVVNTEITFVEDKDSLPLVLDLVCENPGEIVYCGEKIKTGSYTLSLSDKDKLFASYFIGNSAASDEPSGDMMEDFTGDSSTAMLMSALKGLKIKWSLTGDENKLNADFGIHSSSFIELSISAELTPYNASEEIVIPDASNGINLADEIDEKTKNRLTISASKALLEKIRDNGTLNEISEKLDLTDSLEEEIEELNRKERMLENYSGYASYSVSDARRAAEHIRDEFEAEFWDAYINLDESEIEKYPILNNGSFITDVFTIKLYYNENGVQIIDDGGFGFVDFAKLVNNSEEYRNLYCELTVDFNRAFDIRGSYYDYDNFPLLTGVCAVYTDDPNNIPSSLPNTYNYIDGVFEWGGEKNFKEDFVVGTYPSLDEGTSTYLDEQEKFDSRKEALDNYALTVGKAVTVYVRDNPELFNPIADECFSVVLDSSDWSVKIGVSSENKSSYTIANTFKNSDISDYLTEKLKNKDFGGAEIQLHFASENLIDTYSALVNEENVPEQTDDSQVVFIGAAAVEKNSGIDFLNENLPQFYDYICGYCYSWSYNSISKLPTEGKFYINETDYIPFGSWCAATNAPFGSIYDYYE